MELQYQITKEQLIVPMPKEVDHHIAKTISREIDFLIDSWHVRKLIFDFVILLQYGGDAVLQYFFVCGKGFGYGDA